MDVSGDAEAEDALATPTAQAETLRAAPRLVEVTVLAGDEASVPAVTGSETFVDLFILGCAANTHGLGMRSRRIGTLSGLGTDGYPR